MFRTLFFLIIFQIGYLHAEEPDFNYEGEFINQNKPLFVSLGPLCEMALRLRDCEVRHAAFPFDWLILKSVDRFIGLLDDDFEFFLDEKYFMQHETSPTNVINFYYDIFFIHDWPFPAEEPSDPIKYAKQLETIQIKYERRIERFRDLKSYSGKVFFFRSFWFEEGNYLNAKQALDLREALDRYFPELDFTLVIINYTDSNAPVIEGINGVVEYKIRREHNLYDWQLMCRSLLIANDCTQSI